MVGVLIKDKINLAAYENKNTIKCPFFHIPSPAKTVFYMKLLSW